MNKEVNLFNNYIDLIMKKYFTDVDNLFYDEVHSLILDLQMNLLIYIINKKRLLGELKGDTPEERYKYFNEVLCSKGLILKEIEESYPEIIQRTQIQVNKYIKLYKEVKDKFYRDFELLKKEKFILTDDYFVDDSKLSIKVSGDIHNGKGVCIVSYYNQKVVYKNKKIESNRFIIDFLKIINDKLEDEMVLIPDFIGRDGYYWEKYIFHKQISNINDGKKFYTNLGRLLCISYALNISDLHFENLIAFGKYPILVDVETIWNIGAFKTIAKDDSTKILIDKNYDSILNTGLLPISSLNHSFGGDTSGILGGKFLGEIRDIVNLYRDDIHIERKQIKKENYNHLPFIVKKCEVNYLEILDYIEDILNGFDEVGKILICDRGKIVKLVEKYKSKIEVRVLFRNTREYGIIQALLLSPVYSKQEKLLFKKISQKLDYYSHEELSLSEEKQLLNMDIPYFSLKANQLTICENGRRVWSLQETPEQKVSIKINKISRELLEEQKKLIIFSIQVSKALYSPKLKQLYSRFLDYSVNVEEINKGLEELVESILDKEVISEKDGTSNWLTLTVNDFDGLGLEPMDYSIYSGISGVSLAFLECYDILNDNLKKRVKETVLRIYHTIRNAYKQYSDNYSLYVGKLGMLITLNKIESFFNLPTNLDFLDELRNICSNLCDSKNPDLLDGLSSIVDIIFSEDYLTDNFREELVEIKEVLLNTVCFNEDGNAFWNKDSKPNVSLAHGNLGIEIALLELYILLGEPKIKEIFMKAVNFDNSRKLNQGWLDIRNSSHSANWCHGSTGVLISRIKLLQMHDCHSCLSKNEIIMFIDDIQHAIEDIQEVGIEMTNFSLCHGVCGNLLSLSYCIRNDIPINLKTFINSNFLLDNFSKLNCFGQKNGWMCGYGTSYESLGLFTGISGIIFANAKFLKESMISKSSLLDI